jgi:hypothetical protein
MNKLITYSRNSFSLFLNSFKFNRRFFYSLISDLVFYGFLAIVMVFLYSQFADRFMSFSSIDATNMGVLDLNAIAKSFLVQYYSLVFLSAVLFIVVYSGFKSIVWSTLMGLRYNQRYTRKFAILSSLWLLFWVALFFLFKIFFSITNFSILLFLFIFINYFTKILFTSFINNKLNTKKSFDNMIDITFKKGYLFLVPYIFEFLVLLILFFILFGLKSLPLGLFVVLSFLVFLLYSAWTRRYFVSVVDSIKL